LIHRAERELSVDVSRSFVIGDRWLDVRLAHAVGATSVLVRTGYGATEETHPVDNVRADRIADNLMDAVGWVLRPGGAEYGARTAADPNCRNQNRD
jgi:D-glycero-D-manno-heptose 1,7-bisphosphate phosphatase